MDDTVCQRYKKPTDARLSDIKVIAKYFTLI